MWPIVLAVLAAASVASSSRQKEEEAERGDDGDSPRRSPPVMPILEREPERGFLEWGFKKRRAAWWKRCEELLNAHKKALAEYVEYRTRYEKRRDQRVKVEMEESDVAIRAVWDRQAEEERREAKEAKREEQQRQQEAWEKSRREEAATREAAVQALAAKQDRERARERETFELRLREIVVVFERQPHLATREYAERLARRERESLVSPVRAEEIENEARAFYRDHRFVAFVKQEEPERSPQLFDFRDRHLVALGIARDLDVEPPKPQRRETPEEYGERTLLREREKLQRGLAEAQLKEEGAALRQRLKHEALARMRKDFDLLELDPDERDRLETQYRKEVEAIYQGGESNGSNVDLIQ
jgi:hypothetical protein